MTATETEAWIIEKGPRHASAVPEAARLILDSIPLPTPGDRDVVAVPIYGCWEGNMAHAVARKPIDVCRFRGEERVVLGNSGVIQIHEVGSSVASVKPGDYCIIYGNSEPDSYGYMKRAFAYDAKNTIGVLAKRIVLPADNCIPIPPQSHSSLKQWAAFSVRFVTAWANWRVAYGCWQLQMPNRTPIVCGWGGGTALAEVLLAQNMGCDVCLIASGCDRSKYLASLGVASIDRSTFLGLNYDEARYDEDDSYRRAYNHAERLFLDRMSEQTNDNGVSIFIDNIGAPVHRATLKALSRQGVITTAGWKQGMTQSSVRALECISRHIHVHTHYASREEALDAVRYAEETMWIPAADDIVYDWDDIPKLAADYEAGSINSYFPLFNVNGESIRSG